MASPLAGTGTDESTDSTEVYAVQSTYQLKLSGLPAGSTAEVVDGYLSATFEEVKEVTLLGGGTASAQVITDDIQDFLQKKHRIKKQMIEITLADPSDSYDQQPDSSDPIASQDDVYPDLIEVTGDDLPDKENLQLYFEGLRSGGKREKEIEYIKQIDENVVRVKFESADDAAVVVAQKDHMFMKKPLQVRFVPIPPPPPPKLYDKDKLLIKDIPSGVDRDLLTSVIEGRLGLDDETDFTIDFRSNGLSILLFSRSYSDEELNEMAGKITKKKIKKQYFLTVERCEVNHSVIVTGISKNFANEDSLVAYFETARSGGGEDVLEKVEMLSKEKAKLTFKDHLVIQQVLKKEHERLGPNVTITVCTILDSLESSSDKGESSTEEEDSEKEETGKTDTKRDSKTGEKERCKSDAEKEKKDKKKRKDKQENANSHENKAEADMPPPLIEEKPPTVPQHPPIMHPLDPLLAKYVRCKPAITAGIEKEYQVSMTVNEQMGTITISPSPSSPPDWSTKAVDMMHDVFSSSLTKVDIHVPSEAASSIYPMLMKCCSEGGLQYALGQGGNKVAVAGDIDSVTKLQSEVDELTGRLIKKAEEIPVAPEDYAYLKGYMFPVIQQKHRGVQMQCNDGRLTISFNGSLRDVNEMKAKFAQYFSHAKVPVSLSPLAVRFLSGHPGRQILDNLLKASHQYLVPYFFSNENDQVTLLLLCPNESAAQGEAVAASIQNKVASKSENLPQSFQTQVAESAKFNSFKANLAKRYIFSATVHRSQLIIVSTARDVEAVSGEFMRFITEECSVTQNIHLKRGVWRLFHTSSMEKKWTDLVNEMKKKGVQIVSSSKPKSQKPFLQIKGEMQDVKYAKEMILALQADVKERQIPISRPGICQYFFSHPNGQIILRGLETDANVCIEAGVNEEEISNGVDLSTSRGPQFSKVCFGSTSEQKTVSVFVGDITEFSRAEVIVNAANEDLLHGSGVAAAIADKGGPVIQQDSTEYVRRRNRVPVGDAVLFNNVGNLPPPYRAIVHAVGPRWNRFGDNKREIALLKKAVRKSLEKAKDYSSIALPAISSGIFGFPVDVCANTLLEAVVEFSKAEPGASLNDINFIIFEDNSDVFLQAAEKHLKIFHSSSSQQQDSTPSAATPTQTTPADSSTVPGERRRVRRRGTKHDDETPAVINSPSASSTPNRQRFSEATKLMKITKGSIINFQEEALVNTTDKDLGFGGYVAQALEKAAGPGLKEECESVAKPVTVGSVVTTNGYGLKSKHVLHVVLPGYDGSDGNSERVLRQVVQKCLTECTRLRVKSLSMPSIGAGNLRYPNNVVAKALIEETASFLEKNRGKTTLKLVHFVIFDQKIYDEFLRVHQSFSTGVMPDTPVVSSSPPPTRMQQRQSSTPIRQPSASQRSSDRDSCSFSLPHDLKLELLQGDISCDDSDVIVNTTQENLQLIGSGVSGALLKKGGRELQVVCDEAFAKGQKATEGKVVSTRATGDLKCRVIFHIVFRDGKKFSKTIQACLELAEKKKCHSIAFPAVGTGVHRYPAADAAKAVVEALKKFTGSKPPKYLKVIRMVVFQSDIYQQFVTAFKSMGESSGGFFNFLYSGVKAIGSYLTGTPLSQEESEEEEIGSEQNEELEDFDYSKMLSSLSLDSEVVLHIYGETDGAVARAEKKLRTAIDTQFVTEDIVDANIAAFSDSTVSELESFAKSHNVDIDIDRDSILHSVRLHGMQGDVLAVKDQVRDAMSSLNQEKSQMAVAEMLYKTVRWIRLTSQEEEEEYGEGLNYEIEQAYQNKKKIYDSQEEEFFINFAKMKETDKVTDKTAAVKRLDLTEVQEEKPKEWDPMPVDSQGKEKHVHFVTLVAGSPEYSRVETAFNKTMTGRYNQIASIQRLQNPVLYQQYTVRKRKMDKHNPKGHMNERWLWHGTSSNTLDKISTQGFNRSFAGKNATAYGQGVYFARDSSYSHNYTSPDANGYRHMYYTQVLTGEFTVGNTTMVVPPPKNPQVDLNVLFDATVDNVTNPTIFVVYNDAQNYPAYMVNYK